MLILGIESSCDDTAAAVISDQGVILSSMLSSQDEIHSVFGGVVPELASRRHLENIYPLVLTALERSGHTLEQVDLIAATRGPGLIGSLLVGYNFAKSLAFYSDIPFVGVDHMAGHILSVFLEKKQPAFPYVALIVSGGTSSIFCVRDFHSFEHIGRTRDDAAGEAFDKVAKLLDLPYPGGPHVARLAAQGDPSAISFPRARLSDNSFDFSFSGVKTAVLNFCLDKKKTQQELPREDICASFQQAIIDVLVDKTVQAALKLHIPTVVLGGGVSSNQLLRDHFQKQCSAKELQFFCPSPQICTDNAAMIALAGWYAYQKNNRTSYSQDVYSRSQLG